MKCPECKNSFHPQPEATAWSWFSEEEDDRYAFSINTQKCPECKSPIAYIKFGYGRPIDGLFAFSEVLSQDVVFPKPRGEITELPPEIPESIRKDVLEAANILEISPKASAAMSRRILQNVFHNNFSIKARDLSTEIQEFIDSGLVRQIGNFAAHPLKYEHSGEIVEVEPGEAEWTLEAVTSLLDFTFVRPKRPEERRRRLNEKLAQMGKPALRGA